jgi:uncharacterized YigZ family protein
VANDSNTETTPDQERFFHITRRRTVSLKIKRSEFICTLEPVTTVEAAKDFISAISGEHRQATHNCWAYRVGERAEMSHSSDCGEPSGTAGRPMLNTLESNGLTQVVAVVTRYFGGVKLGIRGLIEAYAGTVQAAVDLGPLIRLVRTRQFIVKVPYTFNDTFLHLLTAHRVKILNSDYTDAVTHTLDVEEESWTAVEELLAGYEAGGKIVLVH